MYSESSLLQILLIPNPAHSKSTTFQIILISNLPRSKNLGGPILITGMSSPGVPLHPQILADQYLNQEGQIITTGTHKFSDLPAAL